MANRNEKVGRLDRRITIQRATTAPDAYGTPIESWGDLTCTWAALSYPATGSGEVQHDAVHLATTNVLFTIRYYAGLLPTDRIVYNGQNYDITRISETNGPASAVSQQASRRAYLEIMAELRK